ncbi:MAG: Hsp20/alpha crystallin family protein [Gammaproteobacteria bacterium]
MSNLTRWDPFDISRFRGVEDTWDEWMRRVLHPLRARNEGPLDISVDVSEKNGAYLVKAEIPGVKKEDINVSIDRNMVSISAEVKRESEEKKGEKVIRRERYHGMMQRSFTLPTQVDDSKAEAKYVDGVLELTLPKKEGSSEKKLSVS